MTRIACPGTSGVHYTPDKVRCEFKGVSGQTGTTTTEMRVANALHRCDKFTGNERPALMQIYDALYHQNRFNFPPSAPKLEILRSMTH